MAQYSERDLQDAADFLQLGADRLGTSRIVSLAQAAGFCPAEK